MGDPAKPLAWLRRLLPSVTLALLAAVIYDGAVFYSRWSRDRVSPEALARAESEQARKTLQILGGDRLHIMSFYATPGIVRPGGRAIICYGVNGAKNVRIEPPVEEIRPALSHCLQVTPRADTEYKLIAEDAAGHSVSESFVLKVAP
jgi:hypothetical protein